MLKRRYFTSKKRKKRYEQRDRIHSSACPNADLFFYIYSVGTLPDIRTNKCKTYVVLNDTIVNK